MMRKTNPDFLSPPFDNTVTPGTVTGAAVATARSSRTNERACSANAATTNSSLSIDSFFNSPALPVQQNNNERTTANDEGGREDDLRTRKLLPSLLQRRNGEHQQQQQQQEQQQQQQQQHQENGSLVPGEKDVLCGRGGKKNINHPGNKNYRAVIKTNKAVFDQCRLKTEKRDLSIAIVAAIRAGGGRFLQPQKAEDTNKVGTTTWCEIGDPKAVEKTLQALREKRHDTDRQHEQQTIAAAGVNLQQ